MSPGILWETLQNRVLWHLIAPAAAEQPRSLLRDGAQHTHRSCCEIHIHSPVMSLRSPLSCLTIRLFVHRHVTGTSGFCTCASPSPQSPRRGPGQKEFCQCRSGRPNRAHTHQPGHSGHELLCRQPFLASPTEFIFYFELALEVLLRSPQEPR